MEIGKVRKGYKLLHEWADALLGWSDDSVFLDGTKAEESNTIGGQLGVSRRNAAMIKRIVLLWMCWGSFASTVVGQQEIPLSEQVPIEVPAESLWIEGAFPEEGRLETDPADSDIAHLFPQDWPVTFRGWINGGYLGNTQSPASLFHGPYNSVDRDEIMANQVYGIFERTLPEDQFGLGGRADIFYGLDYNVAASLGWELRPDGTPDWNSNQFYGLTIPQLYADFGRSDLHLQLGHFYTIVGYEGVPATSNFFYSKAYSYQFAGPFTHWGGLTNWAPNDNWAFASGLVNGWNALDRLDDDVNYLGKVVYSADERAWETSFAIITGAGTNDALTSTGTQTRYSWIVDVNPTGKLEYVFHHWLGVQDQDPTRAGGTALWYGIDQYLYYTLSDSLRSGLRFEWFRDEAGTRVGINRVGNPVSTGFKGSFYSTSFGLNWIPNPNVLFRPELRWDFFDGSGGKPFDDGTKDYQLLLGLDLIVQF